MASVIVAGSTGAIGREFVVAAVSHPEISRVVGLSRRDFTPEACEDEAARHKMYQDAFPGIDEVLAAKKLEIVAIDWEELHGINGKAPFKVSTKIGTAFSGHDAAVMAMGTTKKDAGSAANFRHCDYDFVVAFAKLVRLLSGNTLKHYSQVSSSGADKNSWFLYMKTKGEADAGASDVILAPPPVAASSDDKIEEDSENKTSAAPSVPSVAIYKPGLLARGKDKARTTEKIIGLIAPALPVDLAGKAILQVSLEEINAAPEARRQGVFALYNNDIRTKAGVLAAALAPQVVAPAPAPTAGGDEHEAN